MNNLVVIEADSKIQSDIQKYLGFLKEEVSVNYFSNYQEFAFKYFIDEIKNLKDELKDNQPEKPEETAEERAKKNYLKDIGVVLVSVDVLGDDPIAWIQKCKEKIQKNKLKPLENEVRFVILSHENTHFGVDLFCIEDVEDLIFKPLDRQFFLQKIEIILNLPKPVLPSFLFHQKMEADIEMGKQSKIEEISEFGLAIRNPKALAKGQFARFYTKAFSDVSHTSVVAKSYKAFEDPEHKGRFFCYFSYFGINKDQLLFLRKNFQKNQKSMERGSFDDVLHTHHNLTAPEILSKKMNVAVIDLDSKLKTQLKSWVESSFDNARLYSYPSYAAFAKDLFMPVTSTEDKNKAAPKIVDQLIKDSEGELLPSSFIDIQVSKIDYRILHINEHDVKSKTKIMGYEVSELLADECPLWKSILSTDQQEFSEFMSYASNDITADMEIHLYSKAGQRLFCALNAKGNNDRIFMRVSAHPKQDNAAQGSIRNKNKLVNLDLIFIDASFVPKISSDSWATTLRENLKLAGIATLDSRTKIVVMGNEKYLIPDYYQNPMIDDFVYKSNDNQLDKNTILSKLLLLTYTGVPKIPAYDLHYFKSHINVFLTTKVKMIAISEYGVQIKYPAYIRPGSFIRFVSEILQLEDGSPIIGRCIFSDKEADDEGMHICQFMFFGVNDVVFKKIRLWIREKYVSSKASST